MKKIFKLKKIPFLSENTTILHTILILVFSALGLTLSLAINDLFSQIKENFSQEKRIIASIIYICIILGVIIFGILLLNIFNIKNPLIHHQ